MILFYQTSDSWYFYSWYCFITNSYQLIVDIFTFEIVLSNSWQRLRRMFYRNGFDWRLAGQWRSSFATKTDQTFGAKRFLAEKKFSGNERKNSSDPLRQSPPGSSALQKFVPLHCLQVSNTFFRIDFVQLFRNTKIIQVLRGNNFQ